MCESRVVVVGGVCVCVCATPVPKDVGGIGVQKSREAEEAHRALPHEARYCDLRILGLIIPVYLRLPCVCKSCS